MVSKANCVSNLLILLKLFIVIAKNEKIDNDDIINLFSEHNKSANDLMTSTWAIAHSFAVLQPPIFDNISSTAVPPPSSRFNKVRNPHLMGLLPDANMNDNLTGLGSASVRLRRVLLGAAAYDSMLAPPAESDNVGEDVVHISEENNNNLDSPIAQDVFDDLNRNFVPDNSTFNLTAPRRTKMPLMHPVTITVFIEAINDVDELKEKIFVNLWTTLRWRDLRLSWEPDIYDNITNMMYRLNEVWIPRIVLDESQRAVELHAIASVVVHGTYEGWMSLRGTIITTLTCSMTPRKFPFDRQICPATFFSLQNENLTARITQLETWAPGIAEWNVGSIDISINNSYNCYNSSNEALGSGLPYCFSLVKYNIPMQRESMQHVFVWILPSNIMALVAFIGLFFGCSPSERFSFGSAIMVSLVIYLIALSERLPVTRTGIPILAYYYFAMFSLICTAVCFTSFVPAPPAAAALHAKKLSVRDKRRSEQNERLRQLKFCKENAANKISSRQSFSSFIKPSLVNKRRHQGSTNKDEKSSSPPVGRKVVIEFIDPDERRNSEFDDTAQPNTPRNSAVAADGHSESFADERSCQNSHCSNFVDWSNKIPVYGSYNSKERCSATHQTAATIRRPSDSPQLPPRTSINNPESVTYLHRVITSAGCSSPSSTEAKSTGTYAGQAASTTPTSKQRSKFLQFFPPCNIIVIAAFVGAQALINLIAYYYWIILP